MMDFNEAYFDFEDFFESSRQQALDDGLLVDITTTAREVGLRYPLAITPEVYDECIASMDDCGLSEERERALDLASQVAGLARAAISEPVICFDFVTDCDALTIVPLKLVCGRGDFGEPVLTVLHNLA